MNEEKEKCREEWKLRFHAVGRAQTRYLYFLLIAGLFYFALHLQVIENSSIKTDQQLPLLGVVINRMVVWASAPIVIGFTLLAALGTFPAIQRSKEQLDIAAEDHLDFERIDTNPTAIDFIVHSKNIGRLGLLSYPIFLSLFYIEAWWIWLYLLWSDRSLPCWTTIVIIGIIVLLCCIPSLGKIWYSKIKSMIHHDK